MNTGGILKVLLSEKDTEKKKEILEKEFGIPITKEIEEATKNMTGICVYFFEQGFIQGFFKGLEQSISQIIEERARCAHHLMVKQNLTFEAAAEILEISKDDWDTCWEKMKKLGFEKQ